MATPIEDFFVARMHQADASLGQAGRRVARYIAENRAAVLASSARDLAASTGTSDATVVRTVQTLGFAGIAALKQALVASLAERQSPADDMRRTLAETGADAGVAVDLVLETHQAALATLRSPAARAAMLAAIDTLHAAERIVVFGIGPSAALATYAALLLQRAGRRSATLTATGLGLADGLLDLRADDVILALAYGRPYREVTMLFAEARRRRLRVVLITDAAAGRLAGDADVVLPVPRGRARRVALHGVTLMALEALVFGLAAAGPGAAMAALERLNALREAATGQRYDVDEQTANRS